MLYLPVTKDPPVAVSAPVAAGTPVLNGKVLVVEDAAMVRDSVTAMLEDLGCSVMVASDPGQGMDLLRQHCTDLELVVTDILLPGETDGVGLAAFADEHCPQVPVLLMTGHPGETPVPTGNRTVLRKPFLLDDLAQAIVSARPSFRASAAPTSD